MPAERFVAALNDQIEREFGASQQYLAAAVFYEDETLPRLAQLFYDQAVEERGHALMMAKYLLDLGVRPRSRACASRAPSSRTWWSRSRSRSSRSARSPTRSRSSPRSRARSATS